MRVALRLARVRDASRARLLLTPAIVPGVGILLPLALVVCYITRQSQYTSNNILQLTQRAFFYMTEQKNSLSTRHESALQPWAFPRGFRVAFSHNVADASLVAIIRAARFRTSSSALQSISRCPCAAATKSRYRS